MTDGSPELRTWSASDGYPIEMATWLPPLPSQGRAVVLHGVQSHQGWYHGLGRRLANSGFQAHFPDRRGSGSNTRDRGHTPSAERLVSDVVELIAHLDTEGPALPTALVGISWGGKLAVLASARDPERIRALALICPGMKPRVGVPFAERMRIALAYFTDRRKPFPIPLSDPALFTTSPEGQAFIRSDPLALRSASAGLLAASTFLDRRLRDAPSRVRQPALLMLASEDRIVDNDQTREYFARLSSAHRSVIEYPGAHHTLEFEPDPSLYARDLAGWMSRVFRFAP